jgi:hypothetical protein
MASRSGGFQDGLEAVAEILVVLEAVEHGQLIDEDGAEGEALCADEARGGTEPCTSKMPLNWPLKFSMACERR